jgi:hypothetical protein
MAEFAARREACANVARAPEFGSWHRMVTEWANAGKRLERRNDSFMEHRDGRVSNYLGGA